MELISSPWQVVTTATMFLLGMVIANIVGPAFQASRRRSLFLYFWHSIFCVVYAVYVIHYGGDALHYYSAGANGKAEFAVGTAGISFITSFFVSVLGLSFLGTFFAYNIFGFIGLLAFDAGLRTATAQKSKWMRRLATLIVLLPSVSFWSSAIGKDSLSFMATGFCLWAALDPKRRTWMMIAAILIMLLVRPHVAGMIVIALACSYVVQRRIPLIRRLLLGGAALAACAVMVPFALDYAGVGSQANQEDLINYIDQRQQTNMVGGGGIDISTMSLPAQLFTYLFRPLPFESFNGFALAASLDNMILLFLFVLGGWQILRRRKPILEGNRTFMWCYVVLSWTLLAMTSANLGISLRQKWMFAPVLIFLLISVIGKNRKPVPANAAIPPSKPRLHNKPPASSPLLMDQP